MNQGMDVLSLFFEHLNGQIYMYQREGSYNVTKICSGEIPCSSLPQSSTYVMIISMQIPSVVPKDSISLLVEGL
uniref:Uncharacterized protein n=3 Tax=Cycas TaxID=3395 RepID=A6H5I9_CYCTA|nr:hypothetical protein CYtaCp047 [Cycas taitungensis]YP_007474643.1 hypothetical_protein [Cycas revoluta]YP_009308213.1 hypothetical protein [Cycas panzhihuaensis]AEX99192.1 hypothetical_protein [Cycas revoluta]AOS53162.1 hypothetical protein [Cycas panzhihuaensis]BAF64955.1 hypothetical protein [Cycas taitungensis]